MSDPRALDLFERCLDEAPADRTAFLDRHCDSPALRDEVERLLAADRVAGDFLAHPLTAGADRRGQQVGPWRLLGEIGHGGMGTVYLARRDDALFEKQVAVKLLRFDAGDLRERFSNERRILATLDHPNIARLLDAGADAGGTPYVAMEYVDGKPITEFCDAAGLSIRARIELFLKVLEAVQSAHGHLIVHRDLKPANILVDVHAEPKLLDFGIAKLIDDTRHGLTRTGVAPLTPEYASPEQVRGDPVGTASDIYSLGVLLYELISGDRPYDVGKATPSEIERTICTTQPKQPSAVARARYGAPIGRDLDHIVLRALAKTPKERYGSCVQFADDLRRFLVGRPVHAIHAGWTYRARKFVQRRWLAVSAIVLGATTLVAVTLAALHEAHLAGLQRDKTARVNEFLKDMLAAPDPRHRGREVTVAEVLQGADATLTERLHDDADITASLRLTLADTYGGLGLLDAAVANARAAVALVDADSGVDVATRTRAYTTLAEVLDARSEDDEARRWAHRAAGMNDPSAQPWVAQAEDLLGAMDRQKNDLDAAETHYRRALAIYEARGVAPDEHITTVLNNLGIVQTARGDAAKGLALQEQALAIERGINPQPHPQLAAILSTVADARAITKDLDGSLAAFKEALAMRSQLLGDDHPDTIATLSSYANLLVVDMHRPAEAEPLARRAWESAQRNLPAPHQQIAYAGIELSECLVQLGRPAEAVPLLRTALAMRRAMMPPGHPLLYNTESALGFALAESGSIEEGESMMREAISGIKAAPRPNPEIEQRAVGRLAAFEAGRKP